MSRRVVRLGWGVLAAVALVLGMNSESSANPPIQQYLSNGPAVKLMPPGGMPANQWRLGCYGTYNGSGIRIQQVMWNSPAQYCGLEPGDVIHKVNGQKIYGFQHFQSLLNNSNGQVTFLVRDVNTGYYAYVNAFLEPVGGGGVFFYKN